MPRTSVPAEPAAFARRCAVAVDGAAGRAAMAASWHVMADALWSLGYGDGVEIVRAAVAATDNEGEANDAD